MYRTDKEFLASFIRRAIKCRAPLLATVLADYAGARGLTWEQLAEQLGCSEDGLNAVAACRPPRPARWEEDLLEITGDYCDRERLRSVLKNLL